MSLSCICYSIHGCCSFTVCWPTPARVCALFTVVLQVAEYENCRVLLVDKKISTAREIIGILEAAIKV